MQEGLLTYEKFLEGIQNLEAAFRVQPLGEKSLEKYFQKLKGVDDKLWLSAVETIINTETFFPAIACLLKHCNLEPSYDAAGRILKIV